MEKQNKPKARGVNVKILCALEDRYLSNVLRLLRKRQKQSRGCFVGMKTAVIFNQSPTRQHNGEQCFLLQPNIVAHLSNKKRKKKNKKKKPRDKTYYVFRFTFFIIIIILFYVVVIQNAGESFIMKIRLHNSNGTYLTYLHSQRGYYKCILLVNVCFIHLLLLSNQK